MTEDIIKNLPVLTDEELINALKEKKGEQYENNIKGKR